MVEEKAQKGQSLTVEQLKLYRRKQVQRGVSSRQAMHNLAVRLPPGLREGRIPQCTPLGTPERREAARGPVEGVAADCNFAVTAVKEWAQRSCARRVAQGGQWHLSPGRAEAMMMNLKGRKVTEGGKLQRKGVRAALALAVAEGGGTVSVVAQGSGGRQFRWVEEALQEALHRGWVRHGQVEELKMALHGRVVEVPYKALTLLEVGMGWGGFTEGACTVMEGIQGRHVGLDEAQQAVGNREDPFGKGDTHPEILANVSSGRSAGMVRWCSQLAKFHLDSLLGIFISPNCTEESQACHMNGGRRGEGRPRSKHQEDTIDTVVEGVRWVRQHHPRTSVVIEQPERSDLVQEARMVELEALGLRKVRVDGCAYRDGDPQWQHKKAYVLWMTMTEDEFVPRRTVDHCRFCRERRAHPQGLLVAKDSDQQRVRWEGYTVGAARNRMPVMLGEAITEAMVLAWDRD